jgi:SAM-dependent methyltransferase
MAEPLVPTGSVTGDYGPEFFAMHEPWRAEYALLADVVAKHLSFDSVIDFGCGNGYLLVRLKELGIRRCYGVDGSEHAGNGVFGVMIADITEPVSMGRQDLVICMEVIEHVPPEKSDALLDNICHHSNGLVLFSAALPGSGGYRHVNEQPRQHWVDEFNRRGFVVDYALTEAICSEVAPWLHHTPWLAQNAMVLRR